MAKETVGISSGEILNNLYEKLDSLDWSENLWVVKDKTKRAYLPIKLAIQALNKANTTLHALTCEVFPMAALNERETRFLSELESLSNSDLYNVLSLVRKTQDPWWLNDERLSSETLPAERVKVIAEKRLGSHKRLDSEVYPVITSFETLRYLRNVPVDRIHELCLELDVPYNVFTNLEFSVPYYSLNKLADQVFCEYKCLFPSLREILEAYVTGIRRKNREGEE